MGGIIAVVTHSLTSSGILHREGTAWWAYLGLGIVWTVAFIAALETGTRWRWIARRLPCGAAALWACRASDGGGKHLKLPVFAFYFPHHDC